MSTHRLTLAMLVSVLAILLVAADLLTAGIGWILSTPAYFAVAVTFTLAAMLAMYRIGRRVAVLTACAYGALFTVLFSWPLTPRKEFFREMLRIEPGMSCDQVHEIAKGSLPGHPYGLAPWFGADCPANLEFFHHGRGGRMLSADYCEIRYADDRVSEVHLVAD